MPAEIEASEVASDVSTSTSTDETSAAVANGGPLTAMPADDPADTAQTAEPFHMLGSPGKCCRSIASPVIRQTFPHPLMPGISFASPVSALDFESIELGKTRTAVVDVANGGKPLVIYRVDRAAGEYDPQRGRRVDVGVPGAVVVAWDEYQRLNGLGEAAE